VRPSVHRPPIRLAVPYVSNYNASHKMNRPTRLLWFLPSCACCPREPKHRFGLRDATPPYIHAHIRMVIPLHPHLLSLLFHFPSIFATRTQHHGAVEEGRSWWHLGPSSRGDRLHDCRQGGRDFGSTAGRHSQFVPLQQGDKEGSIEQCHRRALLPVYDVGRW
jgi:hypothetical protein